MLDQINNKNAIIKDYHHEYQVYDCVNGKNSSKTFQNDAYHQIRAKIISRFTHCNSRFRIRVSQHDVRTDVAVPLPAKVGRDPAIVKFGRHSSAGFSAEYNAD